MSWSDVHRRVSGLDDHLSMLRRTFAPLREAPRVPELVRIRVLRHAGSDGRRVLVEGYSPFDPVELTEAQADHLSGIDGRPMGALLDRGAPVGIDRALVERLWEFGLIEDASE
jgi:hypothetical protein